MARVDVLVDGYARSGDDEDDGVARVAGTVTLVRSGDVVAVVDPGMVASPRDILDPLEAHGLSVEDVTDVVLSHHHPDHTVNVGLFPGARVHDHWAIYEGDAWRDRPAEGHTLADDVVLWETPGHTPQDISTIVTTVRGVVAITHLWWYEGMESDPRADDLVELHRQRDRVLEAADWIVPGHGPAFEVAPHAQDA